MDDTKFRVMGIDPGSQCFGLSIIEYDLINHTETLVYATTFKPDPILNIRHPYMVLGERGARHRLCEDFVVDSMKRFEPHLVVCESAFFRRRMVNAYRSLVEGIVTIRRAVLRYDDTMHLLTVEPSVAKKAVGARNSDSPDKKLIVRMAINRLKTLIKNVPIDSLDEHAVDSVAIGHWAMTEWLNEMKCIIEGVDTCSSSSKEWMGQEKRLVGTE
ncbi:ribonuclease [Serratia phage vB_SmaS-Totoro]|nr:ribonuclease [Serratia phage vB_SmaS-Totoro]